jgi:hypothetical protein
VIPVGRFSGGRRLLVISSAVGAVGLVATLVGFFAAPRATLFSYLFAFTYWLGLGVGALMVLAGFHASKARWPVVLRRALEAMALGCVPLALLFLPVVAGMRRLFIWVEPPEALGERALELIRHKAAYLAPGAFIVRATVYFALWIAVALLLWGWSRRQDESGDVRLTQRQRALAAGSLPFVGLALSFASLDWVLSLDPLSSSTIFGFYFLSGGLLGALALLALVAASAGGQDLPGALLSPAHHASLGKLLLAAVAFWAYIAFCQYLLIWIANLPNEVPFIYWRTKPGWRGVALFLFFGQFLVPFFALLSKRLKQRPKLQGALAAWLLFAHAADTYWLVMPALHPDRPWWRWTDFTAFAGVGAALVAFCTWALRGGYAVPIRDPYLRHSLRYDQT